MANNSFSLDTSPSYHLDNYVPHYGVSRKSTELIKVEEEVAQRTRPQFQHMNQNPCWNCGKPFHSIRDCPAESSSITVEWNRELQMLMKQSRGFQKNSGRYHQNENSNKYAHIVPGSISDQLRKILGLSENDLPPYIYRLRKHGYPKAWLRHASIRPSGLNLYDAHGKEVADPDAEDGEILEEEDKIRYDLDKLIKFPGFNAPAPENTVDDYDRMDAPAYSEAHSLELMIHDLQEKAVTEYRLKKEKQEKADESITNDNRVSQAATDSTDALLQRSESSKRSSLLDDHECSQRTQDTGYGTQEVSGSRSMEVTPTPVPVAEVSLGRVLTDMPGTPILRSRSGHSRLPSAEKFSKDICDVINFENLPESTGKFDKIRCILKKVKKVLGLQREQNSV